MENIKASLENVSLSKELGKMIVTGCIAKIGVPSTGSPCGADGYNIVFTQESVDSCAKTFEGMPVNAVLPDDNWQGGYEALSGHGTSVVGYMRKVRAKEDNLMAEIVIWKDYNPALAELTVNAMDALGFSIEAYPTKTHADEKKNIQYIDAFEGAGCAMLWSSTAAFSQTFIEKIAANRSDKMNEEIKKLIDEQFKASNDKSAEVLDTLKQSIEELKASVESVVAKQEEMEAQANEIKASIAEPVEPAQIEPEVAAEAPQSEPAEADDVAEIKAELEALKASLAKPAIPVPKAGQQVAENPIADDSEGKYKAEVEKINASAMSPLDKLKAIARAKAQKG
jgi:predicted transcriptional regulator